MKVFIVGAGALGILFGGYLHHAGHRIVYLTRTNEQAEQINTSGCRVYPNRGESFLFNPQALSIDEHNKSRLLADIDIVLITVKQPYLDNVLIWLKQHISSSVPILCLMNGLGHQEKISRDLSNPIYFGVTSNGATRMESVEVIERGRGVTKIGKSGNLSGATAFNGTKDQPNDVLIRSLIGDLVRNQLQVMWSNEIEVEMWRKCIVNACINPLTAMFQVKNGMVVKDPHLHKMMRQLYTEISTLIQKTKGINAQKILNNDRLWKEIEDICRITSKNLSSMLQDIQNKRQTEIESITGYFLREAEKHCLTLPSHEFVYQALRFLVKKGTG